MKTTIVLMVLIVVGSAAAGDWTQWAGNERQCLWQETGILEEFPADGLKVTWSVPIGSGYSGPVVSDGRVFVTDYRPQPETKILEAIERVICLDEQTGEERFNASIGQIVYFTNRRVRLNASDPELPCLGQFNAISTSWRRSSSVRSAT